MSWLRAQGAESGTAGDRSLAGLVGRAFGRLCRAGGPVFLLARLEVSYASNASRSSRKNRRPVRCEGTFDSEDGWSTGLDAAVQVRKRMWRAPSWRCSRRSLRRRLPSISTAAWTGPGGGSGCSSGVGFSRGSALLSCHQFRSVRSEPYLVRRGVGGGGAERDAVHNDRDDRPPARGSRSVVPGQLLLLTPSTRWLCCCRWLLGLGLQRQSHRRQGEGGGVGVSCSVGGQDARTGGRRLRQGRGPTGRPGTQDRRPWLVRGRVQDGYPAARPEPGMQCGVRLQHPALRPPVPRLHDVLRQGLT